MYSRLTRRSSGSGRRSTQPLASMRSINPQMFPFVTKQMGGQFLLRHPFAETKHRQDLELGRRERVTIEAIDRAGARSGCKSGHHQEGPDLQLGRLDQDRQLARRLAITSWWGHLVENVN